MQHVRPHEKLVAWKESFDLCIEIYKSTADFPNHELFGLTKQIRRSAYSIPLNIAEGNAKRSSRDKANFANIAIGSLEELHCQLRISVSLKYLEEDAFLLLDKHLNKVSYLLTRIRKVWLSQ